jgi:hypothetical protein
MLQGPQAPQFLVKPLPVVQCVIELSSKHYDLTLKRRRPVIAAIETQQTQHQDSPPHYTRQRPVDLCLCHRDDLFCAMNSARMRK